MTSAVFVMDNFWIGNFDRHLSIQSSNKYTRLYVQCSISVWTYCSPRSIKKSGPVDCETWS